MTIHRAWGVDIYSQTNVTLTMLQTLKNMGATFVVVKASMGWGDDPKVMLYTTLVKQTGLKLGIYHWADNTNTIVAQVTRFSNLINQIKPDFIAIDDEQWWNDWAKWDQAINHLIPWSEVPRETPTKINSISHGIMDLVHANFPKLWFWHYTGKWFGDEYCPLLWQWVNEYPTFLAEYMDYGWPVELTFTTKETLQSYIDLVPAPILPQGNTNWTARQISGRAKLPGISARQDLDVFNGTADEFVFRIGNPNVTPPPPPPPSTANYKVNNPPSGTYLQPEPNWDKAGLWIKDGSLLTVDESWKVDTAWAKVTKVENQVISGYADRRRITKI
jgi:GH25 family lysozyme M1 (1,4-beta-N-acetylmuramidase)